MKILMVTKTLEPKGGAGRYSRQILEYMEKKRVDCSVATEEGSNDSVQTECFLRPISGSRISSFINFIHNVLALRKTSRNFDVIHTLDIWPYGVYGYAASIGTGKKLFMNGIGTYSVAPFYSRVKSFLTRRACKKAGQIFCISDYTKDRIFEHTQRKNLSVVLYGTFKLPIVPPHKIEEYKHTYQITKDHSPILLTVGDIKKRKGQLDTLKAVALLKGKYPDFLYIMVGSIEDVNYVDQIKDFAAENGLTDNIKIISGMYDDDRLAFFYQICDIFLLNSNNDGYHFEGFGGVLLEAAQFGKPAIGSRDCGIESAIRDGVSGYLARQGDHEDIKAKILMTMENYDMLSVHARELFKDFSWEKTVDKYLEFY